jgi:acetate CoA/acetoacetate CoA-transferase beta subunit
MGGAMDLVTGAKRVIIAMQHTAKGKPKIVETCTLPLTSARPIDMLVSELAVITFPDGKATLVETGPGVTVEQVVAATQAKLTLPAEILQMPL